MYTIQIRNDSSGFVRQFNGATFTLDQALRRAGDAALDCNPGDNVWVVRDGQSILVAGRCGQCGSLHLPDSVEMCCVPG